MTDTKNHSPSYGDNAECDICHDVFDARNSRYEVIGNDWVCNRCLDRDGEGEGA